MTLEELQVLITVAVEESGDLDELASSIRRTAQEAQQQTEKSAAAQSAAWASLAAAAGVTFSKIAGAIQTGIEASNAYTAAMQGLESVSSAKNIGADQMQAALAGVTDAFFDTTAAATAYKNLLSRGYTLDQATNTILRLKDAASFGRQANYTLSEAVTTATEGIKNENSILVDNAGVTKNVAKMWEDYAKKIGVTTTSLTQAQKVQAEYEGIMAETAMQAGDLEKLSGTLAGSQAEAAAAGKVAWQNFGDAMSGIAGVATEVQTGVVTALGGIAEAAPEATAGLTTATAAMTGLVAASAGLSTVKKLLSSLSLTGAGMGWLAGLAAVAGIIAGIVTAVQNARKAAEEAEAAQLQASQDAVDQQQARYDRLNQLVQRYNELTSKENLDYTEHLEMVRIQNELADAYGVTADNARDAADANGQYAASLRALQQAELQELKQQQSANTGTQRLKAMKDYGEALGEVADDLKAVNGLIDEIETDRALSGSDSIFSQQELDDAKRQRQELLAQLRQADSEFVQWYQLGTQEIQTKILARGDSYHQATADALRQMFQIDLSQFDSAEAASDYVTKMLQAFEYAITDADVGKAMNTLTEEIGKALSGESFDQEALLESWAFLTDGDNSLLSFLNRLSEESGVAVETLLDNLMQSVTGVEDFSQRVEDAASGAYTLTETLTEGAEAASAYANAFGEMGSEAENTQKQFDASMASVEKCNRQIETLGRQKTAIQQVKELAAQLKSCEKNGAEYNRVAEQLRTKCKAAGISTAALGKNFEGLDDAVTAADESVDAAAAGMASDLSSVISWAEATRQSLIMQGNIDVDNSPAIAALEAIIAMAREAQAALLAAGVNLSGSGGGGGGGGGGGSKADDAEKKAEEARKKALQADYDRIEHRRHLNEISLEEELAGLEEIRRKHQMTAEEIMAWEEKVYDLKKEIRERDADSIDRLADGVVSALEKRYEAMRDAEIERLDKSREAWEQWRDDSVAAIEDQIAALDQLADTEDEEKKSAEELRKIEKLRREVEYEQDAYNRQKLQQQLDEAVASREERLRKLELKQQKEALQEEIERIRERASEKIKELDGEQDAIEKAYEERLKAASLQAEAEKLLMTKSQNEIMDLLYEYVPEYDALGKSMGEKLLEGFQSKVGSIADWFRGFNDQLARMQEELAGTMNAATDRFYESRRDTAGQSGAGGAPVVQQTVNFYEPVESPSQVARRMEDVNDQLGWMMA